LITVHLLGGVTLTEDELAGLEAAHRRPGASQDAEVDGRNGRNHRVFP
jgi:hypothetical protein